MGVIFPSAGTAAGGHAAFVQAMGRHVDPHVRMGGFSGAVTRDLIASGHDFTPGIVNPDDPCDVYIFASPANSRGDAVVLAVEQAVEKLPEASFVLLNPDLEDTVLSYTFGIHTSDKCRKFVSNFETTYAYRGIFQIERPSNRPLERGAVLHHHGGPWTAHGLCQKAGGFELLASFDSKPSKAELGGVPW